jgi:hypothetical protein
MTTHTRLVAESRIIKALRRLQACTIGFMMCFDTRTIPPFHFLSEDQTYGCLALTVLGQDSLRWWTVVLCSVMSSLLP